MYRIAFLLIPCSLLLISCEATKESLGFSQVPPDEFVVTSHAPLEIPGEKNLEKPKPGMKRPQEKSPRQRAHEALFYKKSAHSKKPTHLENILMVKVAPKSKNPDICCVVETEADNDAKLNIFESAIERFHKNNDIIDPEIEMKRLKKQK